ncbi:MAG: hypothetical protein HXY34_06635 [Candidatus Thorarchaeota archaeon]|nr:hypothetical protein [Candidatus Thorarchaeota archaeon]
MAIDPFLLGLLYSASFLPFLILGAANLRTELFRRALSRQCPQTLKHSGRLPLLVRLHAAEVRTLRRCLSITVVNLMVFFGLPLLAVAVLWPEDLLVLASETTPTIAFISFLFILRVLCISPDLTGGLKCEIAAHERNGQ